MTIVEFLTARLAEDKAAIAGMELEWGETAADNDLAARRARALREVEAKRAVMALTFQYEAKIDGEWNCCHSSEEIRLGYCPETKPDEIDMLRALAATYRDHPDYDPAWSPVSLPGETTEENDR